MKAKLFYLLYLLFVCFTTFANCDYVPGQILIKMKANKTKAQKTSLKNEMKATTVKSFFSLGIELWDVSASSKNGNINHIISQYKNHPDIDYIEPNYRYDLSIGELIQVSKPVNKMQQSTIYPNDQRFNNQWHLDNTGQFGGTPGVDINAPEAWDILSGSPDIEVAILDSGIDWTHEDLANNIWQNLGEDADNDGQVLIYQNEEWIFDPGDENGIDDDGNGYTDDFVGWDFVNNNNTPEDGLPHGTHVAGIVGAESNNVTGIAGVSWSVQMAGLKMMDDNGVSTCSMIIEAIEYSIEMNFDISNCSWSIDCESESMSMGDAIESAQSVGQLYVISASNGGIDNIGDDNDGVFAAFPASYPLDNIISVASIETNGALSNFSNYGANSVDIAAPGRNILSTLPGNTYGTKTGTSHAAPQVAAACALLLQLYPNYNYNQIKNRLINTATNSSQLVNKCVSEGWLNLEAMLSDSLLPNPCIPVNDSLALVELYVATNGINWLSSWNLDQPMDTWHGVSVNIAGCVSDINMPSNGLSGIIPPSIGNLNYLLTLQLAGNDLKGNIPAEIGDLERLDHLNLSGNNLVGYIPSEIGNLSLLRILRLQNNQLIGSVPEEFINLSNLTILNTSSNRLQGCYETNLSALCNRFSGDSQISNGNNFDERWSDFCIFGQGLCNGNGPCRSVDSLVLRNLYNATNGANWNNTTNKWNSSQPISNWYGVTLNSNGCVERLDLVNNNLSGNIPASIGNLGSLVELQLWANRLSGGIPPEIGDLFYLNKLVLSSKLPPEPQLGGTIPVELGKLKNLEDLSLNSNGLSGPIPADIGDLIRVSSNLHKQLIIIKLSQKILV